MTDLLTAPDLTAFMPDLQAAADRLAGQSWPDLQATLRRHLKSIYEFETLEAFIQWNVDWTHTRRFDGLQDFRAGNDQNIRAAVYDSDWSGKPIAYDVAMVDPTMIFSPCYYDKPNDIDVNYPLCNLLMASLARTGRWHFAPFRLALGRREHFGGSIGFVLAHEGRKTPRTDVAGMNWLVCHDGIHRLQVAKLLGVPAVPVVIGRAADRPEPTPDLAAAIQWLEGAERDEMLKRALPELREAEAS